VESLINDLVTAKMIVRGDDPKGLVLAQAPENISVVDVLRVVQHQPHAGPQAFAVGADTISQLLIRRDAAVETALEGKTLRSLLNDSSLSLEQDVGLESTSEMDLGPGSRSQSVQDPPDNPDSLKENTPGDSPSSENWRSR
jgi:DNA-binding IscR family transcriptional regulator